MKVYIAGPYTNGDTVLNVRQAIETADKLLELGHIPFIPHLTHFWHFISPKPWETWLYIDREYLSMCEAVLRLQGESVGADEEVAYAKALKIPVYYSIKELEP